MCRILYPWALIWQVKAPPILLSTGSAQPASFMDSTRDQLSSVLVFGGCAFVGYHTVRHFFKLYLCIGHEPQPMRMPRSRIPLTRAIRMHIPKLLQTRWCSEQTSLMNQNDLGYVRLAFIFPSSTEKEILLPFLEPSSTGKRSDPLSAGVRFEYMGLCQRGQRCNGSRAFGQRSVGLGSKNTPGGWGSFQHH